MQKANFWSSIWRAAVKVFRGLPKIHWRKEVARETLTTPNGIVSRTLSRTVFVFSPHPQIEAPEDNKQLPPAR